MAHGPSIGKAELEVLRYVSDHQPVTVGHVAEHLATAKGQARTTVLTVMERLRKKGYLKRKRVANVYHYSTRLPKAELLHNLVREFVDTALGGSLSPFVAYLSRRAALSKVELSELRQLIQDLGKDRQEE